MKQATAWDFLLHPNDFMVFYLDVDAIIRIHEETRRYNDETALTRDDARKIIKKLKDLSLPYHLLSDKLVADIIQAVLQEERENG